MKQIFNKITFFFMTLIVSIFTASNVFAFVDESKLGVGNLPGENAYGTQSYSKAIHQYDSLLDYTVGYHKMYYDSRLIDIFCIDTCLHAGGTSAVFKVNRQLDPKKPLDAAVLYVISSDKLYATKLVALRALEYFFPDFNSDGADCADGMANYRSGVLWASQDKNRYIIDILGLDLDKKTVSDSKLEEILSNYGVGKSSYDSHKSFYLVGVDDAKELFLEGLKYGSEVARGKHISDKSVVFSTPTFNNSKVDISTVEGNYEPQNNSYFSRDAGFDDLSIVRRTNNNSDSFLNNFNKLTNGNINSGNGTNNTYLRTVKEINFSATFKKFDDATPVDIVMENSSNIRIDTGTLYFFDVASNSWKQYSKETLTKTIASHFTSQNEPDLTINFKYDVTAYLPFSMLTSDSKVKLKISLFADYIDETFFSGALIYNDKSYETQRFFIFDKDGTTHSGQEFELTLNLTADFCYAQDINTSNTEEFKAYLKLCCRGENSTGFNIHDECEKNVKTKKTKEEQEKERQSNAWCQKEQLYCSVCDGTISVPQVCSEFGEDGVPKCDDNADAVIKDNDNIKLCVLDYSDLAKNDYKMTTDDNVAKNDYCTVYCKEDYRFSLPLGRWVSPGRSFTVGLNASATKTCYTDLINYDKFVTDLNEQKRLLDINVNDPNARGKYAGILKQYKTCAEASWNSDIKFDPKISIIYDEKEYLDKFKDGKLDFKVGTTKDGSTLKVSNDNKWLCNGTDVDDYYNVCKNGLAVSDPTTTTTETFSGYYDPNTFAKTNITVPKTRFAKKVSFASAVYVPKDNLYVQAGTGVVQQSATVDLKTYQKLATELEVNGEIIDESGQLPVSLKRETGIYKFNIEFAGVGEFFNSGKTGRFVGDKNSVALADGKTTFKGEYICSYTVNCPECSTEGFIPPFDREIEINNPPTPEDCIVCSVEPACINYCDNSNGIFIARQISLNNVKPTNRAYGINFAGLKGITAVGEIEDHGTGNAENIYNGKAEYSITLTPSETRKLQQYNNVKLNSGGYTSFDDFECIKYSDYVGKGSEYYEKIKDNDYLICTSKLLRNNVSGYELKDVKISDNKNYSWIEACDKETNSKCFMGGFYGPAYK